MPEQDEEVSSNQFLQHQLSLSLALLRSLFVLDVVSFYHLQYVSATMQPFPIWPHGTLRNSEAIVLQVVLEVTYRQQVLAQS